MDPADLVALIPAAAARRMSAPSRFAVASARLALQDAGIEEGDSLFAATAVVIATSFGPSLFSEKLLATIFGPGPQEASPALFTESVASAAAAQVALNFKALGPNVTITQREAGGLLALAEGARLVAAGRAERVLVGAVDELTPLLHAVLDRFRALAEPDAEGRELARPFDRERAGVVTAEGACVLVLEAEEAARARHARLLCRVVASGAAFDPTAPQWSWGSGDRELGSALRRIFERGGDRAQRRGPHRQRRQRRGRRRSSGSAAPCVRPSRRPRCPRSSRPRRRWETTPVTISARRSWPPPARSSDRPPVPHRGSRARCDPP